MYGFEAQISANKAKTTVLMLVFILLMAALGWAAGYFFMPVDPSSTFEEQAKATAMGTLIVSAFILIAVFSTGVSFWFSDAIITKLVNARPANPEVYKEKFFIDTLEGLVLACGLPNIPRAFVIESPALNAFATGRDPQHSIIAVTTGLLESLDRQELEGVIAHEMGHVYNRDIMLMGVAAILVGGVAMFCNFALRMLFYGGGRDRDSKGCGGPMMIVALLLIILAPIFANMLNMMVSRKREYLADATAVMLTRNPEGLIGALNKISGSDEKMPFVEKELSGMFIDHPQKVTPKAVSWWANLSSTHPPIESRIDALKKS